MFFTFPDRGVTQFVRRRLLIYFSHFFAFHKIFEALVGATGPIKRPFRVGNQGS